MPEKMEMTDGELIILLQDSKSTFTLKTGGSWPVGLNTIISATPKTLLYPHLNLPRIISKKIVR